MYAALWKMLPGPTSLRAALATALSGGVLLLLFLVVFPWAESHLPFLAVTVE